MIADTLRTSGNFLTLSRRHPDLFSNPLTFNLANGTHVSIIAPGIICFEPDNYWHCDIVLSSAIHGNETAPIEICDDLVQRILKEELLLAHRVLFVFGNLPSIDIEQRFVDENMNRLFAGRYNQSPGLVNPERLRAKQCDEAVVWFFNQVSSDGRKRFHYDLHTAIRASKRNTFAVYPFTDGIAHSKEVLTFMADCGVNTILLSSSATTTFSYNSWQQFGVHAMTVELGKVMPFGENDMSKFAKAKASIEALVSGTYQSRDYNPEEMEIFEVSQVVTKHAEDFELHFSEQTPNFTAFPIGTVVASDSIEITKIKHLGEAIVFPNSKVKLDERAMLMVAPGTIIE